MIAEIKTNVLQSFHGGNRCLSRNPSLTNGTQKTMSEVIHDILDSASIEQLNSLIKKAQEEIDRKKVDEIQVTRHRWFEEASQFGMTPQEVLDYSGRRKGKAKYRNPENPDLTWTGRGKRPGWLKDVADIEAYRIPE